MLLQFLEFTASQLQELRLVFGQCLPGKIAESGLEFLFRTPPILQLALFHLPNDKTAHDKAADKQNDGQGHLHAQESSGAYQKAREMVYLIPESDEGGIRGLVTLVRNLNYTQG